MMRLNFEARRATTFVATPMLLATLLFATGCPEEQEPCDPCPPLAGRYVVESIFSSGDCQFVPMTITGSLILQQLPDETGSDIVATVLDPVTQTDFQLTGDALEPRDGDPEDVIAGISLYGETVRQASQLEARLATLQVYLLGDVREDDDGLHFNGSLNTTDVSPPARDPDDPDAPWPPQCTVTVSFTAVQRSDA